MNPEDYLKLIDRKTEANFKAATARRDWVMKLNTRTFEMNDEELEAHRWRCNDLRTAYLRCRAESLELSETLKAAYEDKP